MRDGPRQNLPTVNDGTRAYRESLSNVTHHMERQIREEADRTVSALNKCIQIIGSVDQLKRYVDKQEDKVQALEFAIFEVLKAISTCFQVQAQRNGGDPYVISTKELQTEGSNHARALETLLNFGLLKLIKSDPDIGIVMYDQTDSGTRIVSLFSPEALAHAVNTLGVNAVLGKDLGGTRVG